MKTTIIFIVTSLLIATSLLTPIQAAEIRVAAASNLRYVLPVLAELYEQQTGVKMSVTYAASGTLTTQIQHGAPYEIFMSANTDYIKRLMTAELTRGNIVDYAQAEQVFFVPNHSKLSAADGVEGLKKAIENNELRKVAIANPIHAPYGQAAKQELERLGIWQQIQPYLLFAENASQVMQFSLSSTVDAGFIPYSYLIQPQFASKGQYVKLEGRLPQQAILIRGASAEAEPFLVFLKTDHAADILRQHGFAVDTSE